MSFSDNKSVNSFLELFPPPNYMRMPSVGIDMSDHSVRFIEFKNRRGKKVIGRFGQRSIPDGVLSYGNIKDKKKITEILSGLAREEGIHFVRSTLPEEKAYLFKISVPVLNATETRDNISFQLEENVPLNVADAIFDYVFLPPRAGDTNREVVVSVFPRAVVEEYMSMYQGAGMVPLSFEMEADALSRALIKKDDLGCYMIVDFGQQRTGLSIVERGVVQFASTVDVGGIILTAAVQKKFNVSFEEAERIKKEEMFVGHGEHRDFFSTLMNSVSALSDEVNKHYIYWHTHTDRDGNKMPPIKKIILCGGDANLVGLSEHLSILLKTNVELGDVWVNAFSLEGYVPEIPFASSLSYATVIGLGLRD